MDAARLAGVDRAWLAILLEGARYLPAPRAQPLAVVAVAVVAGVLNDLDVCDSAGAATGGTIGSLQGLSQRVRALMKLRILRIGQRECLQQFLVHQLQTLTLLVETRAISGARCGRQTVKMKLRQTHDRTRVLMPPRGHPCNAVAQERTQQQAQHRSDNCLDHALSSSH